MAATYSSFMTTRFYSPVFNTALFDGPFRIYFSQSYETSALKIYHLLQSQHQELWNQLKAWSLTSKEHIFLLMYPEAKDLQMIFGETHSPVCAQTWDEGVALGIAQPTTDAQATLQLDGIVRFLKQWIGEQKTSHATI